MDTRQSNKYTHFSMTQKNRQTKQSHKYIAIAEKRVCKLSRQYWLRVYLSQCPFCSGLIRHQHVILFLLCGILQRNFISGKNLAWCNWTEEATIMDHQKIWHIMNAAKKSIASNKNSGNLIIWYQYIIKMHVYNVIQFRQTKLIKTSTRRKSTKYEAFAYCIGFIVCTFSVSVHVTTK